MPGIIFMLDERLLRLELAIAIHTSELPFLLPLASFFLRWRSGLSLGIPRLLFLLWLSWRLRLAGSERERLPLSAERGNVRQLFLGLRVVNETHTIILVVQLTEFVHKVDVSRY